MSSFAPGTPESYMNAVNQKLYGTAPTTAQPMQQSPSYPQYPMGQQLGMPNSLAQINKLFNTLGPQQKPLNTAGPGVGIDPNISLIPQDPYFLPSLDAISLRKQQEQAMMAAQQQAQQQAQLGMPASTMTAEQKRMLDVMIGQPSQMAPNPYDTDTFPVPPGFQPIGPGIGGRPFDPTNTDSFPVPLPGLGGTGPGGTTMPAGFDFNRLLEMLRGMGGQPQNLSPIPAPPQQKPRDRVRQNEINQVEKRLAMLQNMPNARQAQLERATNRLNRLRGAQQVAPGLLGLLG